MLFEETLQVEQILSILEIETSTLSEVEQALIKRKNRLRRINQDRLGGWTDSRIVEVADWATKEFSPPMLQGTLQYSHFHAYQSIMLRIKERESQLPKPSKSIKQSKSDDTKLQEGGIPSRTVRPRKRVKRDRQASLSSTSISSDSLIHHDKLPSRIDLLRSHHISDHSNPSLNGEPLRFDQIPHFDHLSVNTRPLRFDQIPRSPSPGPQSEDIKSEETSSVSDFNFAFRPATTKSIKSRAAILTMAPRSRTVIAQGDSLLSPQQIIKSNLTHSQSWDHRPCYVYSFSFSCY